MLWGNRGRLKDYGFYLCRTGVNRNQHAALSNQLVEMRRNSKSVFMKSWRALIKGGDAWELLSSESSKKCYHELLKETGGVSETCLLTSEGFQNASPDFMAMLYPPRNTKIVLYLREQLSYLLSAYAQSVQGLRATTESLVEYSTLYNLNYLRQVEEWVRVYGEERVILRVYERDRFPGRDIRIDFLDILGISEYECFKFPEKDANPSIAGTLLEFKRIVNKVSTLPADVLLKMMYPLTMELALGHAEFRGNVRVNESFSNQVRKRYKASNEEMFQKYFSGIEGFRETSFISSGKPSGYVDSKELDLIWSFIKEREPEFVGSHYDLVMREID